MTASAPSLLTALVALLALTSTAFAHFTLSGPVRSREGAMWPNDNRKYFPIGGTTSPRPILDCLDIPKSPSDIATLRAGSSLDLGFEIGNGARHVGICTATLVDAKTRRELHRFEDEKDCVNRRDAMKISLPASKTCEDCVIVVKVAATHISAANPEFFDSCMDVRVVGGNEPYVPGQPGQQRPPPAGGRNQRAPTPTPAPAPAPQPQPQPQPIVAPAPQPEPEPEPIAAPAPAPAPAPARPAPIQQRPPVSGVGAGACGEHGKMQCRRDGKKFRQCVHGAWVEQDVPAGTKCAQSGPSIVIQHA